MNINKLKKYFRSKTFRILIFLAVFCFTFILRSHNYEKTPGALHLDEMLYAWSGLYLIETGTPVSWSTLDYPKRAEVFKGIINYKGGQPETSVILYKPWLDEPPLFSLIVGYFAHIYNADREDFIPSSYIRMPAVIFAALTSILIFLITRSLSGFWTGLLAMTIYGTVPIFVFASRVALPENLIALLFVLMAYLLIKFQQQPKFRYILPIPFMVGIAGLSKPTGFFLIFIAIYITFKKLYETAGVRKAIKKAAYLILATTPFIGLFILYGLYYDPEIFWRITSVQSFRPVGFKNLAWFFVSPSYGTQILVDGWYIFCLLAAAYFLVVPKEGLKKMISLFFVFWVGVIMISGGEGDLLAWYRFPAFPFLAILGAWGLQLLVQKSNLYTSFLAVGLLLSGRSLLVNAFRPNIAPLNFRIILSMLFLPSILGSIFDSLWLHKLTKTVIVGVMLVGIYLNIVYIYNEFELACESISCPLVPSTFLSELHFPLLWRFFVLGVPAYK